MYRGVDPSSPLAKEHQSGGFMTRRLNVLIGLAVMGLALAGTAWANGEEFFSTGDTKLDFYYFGHIKDTDGTILDNAVVTVTAKNVPIKFPCCGVIFARPREAAPR